MVKLNLQTKNNEIMSQETKVIGDREEEGNLEVEAAEAVAEEEDRIKNVPKDKKETPRERKMKATTEEMLPDIEGAEDTVGVVAEIIIAKALEVTVKVKPLMEKWNKMKVRQEHGEEEALVDGEDNLEAVVSAVEDLVEVLEVEAEAVVEAEVDHIIKVAMKEWITTLKEMTIQNLQTK